MDEVEEGESKERIGKTCDFCGKNDDLIEESGFRICKSCALGC